MNARSWLLGGVATIAIVAGCRKGELEIVYFDSGPPDGSASFGGEGGSFSGEGGGGTTTGECNSLTQLIYVVSDDSVLHSFDPTTTTFKTIGIVNCPTGGAKPTSMGVDRDGMAWVRHSDGSIWRVSTLDASCTSTVWTPPVNGFQKFGMGFSTDTAGGSTETLYVSDDSGEGLAKVTLPAMQLTKIANYDGALTGVECELTGTGDGKLYGLFTTSPVEIAEIDKGTAHIISTSPVADTYAGTAWALSFYAGDFYVYTADTSTGGLPMNATGSDVTRYRPADGTTVVVKPKIGFTIVGAGVSTCVPTAPPK